MEYSIRALAEICGGTIVGKGDADMRIHHIFTDSRRALSPTNTLFVALKGESHNGAVFIPELIRSGFRYFLIQESVDLKKEEEDALFIQVPDSLAALQKIAAYHRNQHTLQLIAITGSNGKTIVKDGLAHVLESVFSVVKSPRSYNSQVGVPLSLLQINRQHELGIFEAGISQVGEMNALQKMIRPKLGIFTNIHSAHQANFADFQEKAREKALLFREAEAVIVRAEHNIVREALSAVSPNCKQLIWSTGEEGEWRFVYKKEGFTVSEQSTGESFHFPLIVPDAIRQENMGFIICVSRYLGLSWAQIKNRIEHLPSVEMRMEFIHGKDGTVIVNDAYNADPESLKMALESIQSYRVSYPKTLILTDFDQILPDSASFYPELLHWLDTFSVEKFIGVGEALKAHRHLFPENARFYANTTDLLRELDSLDVEAHTVLVKGARRFQLEEVVKQLTAATHRTRLEVNVTSMERNLRYYRSKLPPSTAWMVMVKSFSYGIGAVEMARFLEYQQLDYLAVAYADEGVELRQAGIELPILVLNPEVSAFLQMKKYKLEPEIYSFELFDEWTAQSTGITAIHLKIETGMNRLGFSEVDIPELLQRLENLGDNVRVLSVFSHLIASDDPHFRDFSLNQIEMFRDVASRIEHSLGYSVKKHILNSGGISFYPEAAMDMVRLGIGLYGISQNAEERSRLSPALRWISQISQIRRLKKGDVVGYSASYVMPDDGTIAVVSVGYGDGLRRSLSNGKGQLYVHGKACNIVGKVCMDMCMIDVTHVDCQRGDEVEIFGDFNSIEELSRSMDTIPYELLTGISPRVQRLYFRE